MIVKKRGNAIGYGVSALSTSILVNPYELTQGSVIMILSWASPIGGKSPGSFAAIQERRVPRDVPAPGRDHRRRRREPGKLQPHVTVGPILDLACYQFTSLRGDEIHKKIV